MSGSREYVSAGFTLDLHKGILRDGSNLRATVRPSSLPRCRWIEGSTCKLGSPNYHRRPLLSPTPMLRILEPEIMDDREQSRVYANADFSDSNQGFVDRLLADYPEALRYVIDIGCGPCDVVLRLASARPDARIIAIDGSAAMIELASAAVRAASHKARIAPMRSYIPGLPLENHSFDAILSKDLLHHLPDPMVLWNEARRLGRQGAAIYVMDLIRPGTQEGARHIVETVASREHPILKRDFYNSLCAAFTLEEVKAQIRDAGLLLEVAQISHRHMLIKGVLG